MKIKKILLGLLFCLLALPSISGCDKNDADLVVSFYNGGYGEDWAKNLVSRFEQAKGVKVKLNKSEEPDCGAKTNLTGIKNGTKNKDTLSDVYVTEGLDWKSLVKENVLADLSDVYNAKVETSNGQMSIKDFMDDDIVGNFYAQRQLKEPEYLPWAMPWTAKPNGMAYNEDILLSMKHNPSNGNVSEGVVDSNGKWCDVPQTIDDLRAFCLDVYDFDNNSPEKQALNDTHKYVPLGWAGGKNADSVGFLVISWWAEAQGLRVSNYKGEGSFYDFFNFGNTSNSHLNQTVDLNVYNQSGLKLAYNTLASFLVKDNKFINTFTECDPYSQLLQTLQQKFVANKVDEKPVLSIASSYLENEVIKNKYIDSDQDGKQDVNFKFMNVPRLHAESEKILYLNYSDSIVIPAAARHLDLAKEFLIFMSSEAEVVNFAKETRGGIRPFDCVVRTDANKDDFTAFTNSLFDVYYNSTHFCEYPCNVDSLAGVSHIFRSAYTSYIGNLGWEVILNRLRDKGEESGEAIAKEVIFALEQNNLEDWLRRFKMTDITKR